ncbi:MAG: metabolite traffic protein EboE [Planctomycetes bacterium]|nr:metabolite traffic protein EboE [Planctomycetota bacterium]
MLIQDSPPLHLTYCLNIHPGETWDENFAAIRTHALKVRDRLGIGKPFGLGLRLSAAAAEQLSNDARMADFRRFLQAESLYVFTINGFPYGQFHETQVKENVYRPDWQDPRRSEYTIQLADVLAELLPEGVHGSISTVPCSYKPWITSPRQAEVMAVSLAGVAAHLAEVHRLTGRDISLALEPEPDCCIETTGEAVDFFRGPMIEHGLRRLRSLGMSSDQAQDCLRRHLGVCVDTAHVAVEFEDAAESLRRLQSAGVRICKVQLSAALALHATEAALHRLADFRDTVYLHQARSRTGDGVCRAYGDLPDVLADTQSHSSRDELRVHFHVPLFCDHIDPLASTSALLTDEFWGLLRGGVTCQAEIETYTFDVLPKDLQTADVTESIAREYEWVLARLGVRPDHDSV